MADEYDDENPEWTAEMFARARPASEALPPEAVAAFGKPRGGRPKAADPKKAVSIRLSSRVLDYYRSQGAGWQTRLNADLEAMVSKRS